MKKLFSNAWKGSSQPRKQRKYRFNAPLHVRGKFLGAHLSPELRKTYNTRTLRIRTGDKVKVMRGQFKGEEGKVDVVNTKRERVYVTKIEIAKADGTKARYPLKPSNLMIIEVEKGDKKRFKEVTKEVKKETKKEEAQ